MNPTMLGAVLVYGIPFVFTLSAGILLRWLFRSYEARDVMGQFRADPRHVHQTERLLRVTRIGKPR